MLFCSFFYPKIDFLSVINKLQIPAITNDVPAKYMGAMAVSPKSLDNRFTPPTAAIICGITINILNNPKNLYTQRLIANVSSMFLNMNQRSKINNSYKKHL